MTLVIDSREQDSLKEEFKPGVFDEVVIDGLPVGDYWMKLDGHEVPICFERKGLGDLFGTMTSGHERFKKMLEKAKNNNLQVILLIEGTMKDIFQGYKHSTIPGQTILKTVFTLFVKYDLFPVFCEDRRTAARFIEETYSALARSFSLKDQRGEGSSSALARVRAEGKLPL